MADIASVSLVLQTDGLKKAVDSLDALVSKGEEADRAIASVASSLDGVEKKLSSVGKNSGGLDTLGNLGKNSQSAVSALESGIRKALSAVSDLGNGGLPVQGGLPAARAYGISHGNGTNPAAGMGGRYIQNYAGVDASSTGLRQSADRALSVYAGKVNGATAGTDARTESIRSFQAAAQTAYGSSMIAVENYADAVEQTANLQSEKFTASFGDMQHGAQLAFSGYAGFALDASRNAQEFIGSSLLGIENALVSMATAGKYSFSDMVNSMLQDLMRLIVRTAILGPIANAVGSLFAPAATSTPGSADASTAGMAAIQHSGGIAGSGSGMMRTVPHGVFAGAPRYHSGGIAGLLPNEVPAILERGEVVVPNHISRGLAPLSAVREAMFGQATTNVEVHIHDYGGNSSKNAEVKQTQAENGGTRIDVILREAMDSYIYGGKADNHFAGTFGLRKVNA